MVVAAENVLGIGLYTLDEVALYARVSKRLAMRWFFEDQGRGVFTPNVIEGKFVSFLDFVQMMAIREIRQQKGEKHVTLEKIRQLLTVANEQGVTYPFARKGIAFQWHKELGLMLPDGRLIEASGRHRRAVYLKEIVVVYKDDLGFDDENLANLYHAYRWDGCKIEMDPRKRFGEPMVTSCGYSAQALWEAAADEGSVDKAARAYGVDRKEVETACRYFDMLQGKAA